MLTRRRLLVLLCALVVPTACSTPPARPPFRRRKRRAQAVETAVAVLGVPERQMLAELHRIARADQERRHRLGIT